MVDTLTSTRPRSRDGRRPQRWAVVLAHLVAVVTLPSGRWRLGLVAGFSLGVRADGMPASVHGWEAVSIAGLSVISEAVALLTLGLVQPWGEWVPAWLPVIGGRRVAPFAAIVPASAGAVALALIWAWGFRHFPNVGSLGFANAGWHALMLACYLPLLLWAPLLAAVTYGYYRRRCRD